MRTAKRQSRFMRRFAYKHQKTGDYKMDYVYRYDSPVGKMTMASDGTALTGLWFVLPVFEDTISWLDTYFGGEIPDFTPELSVQSTPFRKAVWDILLNIPYGQTITYGEIADIIAQQTGKKMSAQAVGGAVGHNPVSIIIPCHRVVGADGSMTGYAGGIVRKKFLLELEGNKTRKNNYG